jgi:hypothetical protein
MIRIKRLSEKRVEKVDRKEREKEREKRERKRERKEREKREKRERKGREKNREKKKEKKREKREKRERKEREKREKRRERGKRTSSFSGFETDPILGAEIFASEMSLSGGGPFVGFPRITRESPERTDFTIALPEVGSCCAEDMIFILFSPNFFTGPLTDLPSPSPRIFKAPYPPTPHLP